MGVPPAIYVWQVMEHGEWGSIAVGNPGVPPIPLVTRSEKIARSPEFRMLASMHQSATGLPVRLARYFYDTTLERIDGDG